MAQVLPAERDLRRVIGDADGAGDREVEGLGEQELLEIYRSMVLLRTYDERSVVYHRQGRIGTYAIFWNHEAMQAGAFHYRVASICVPIGTHVPHAAGLAWGKKLRGEHACALVFFGDGATSEGSFHEGANLAAVTGAPLVLFCNNNYWAISTPLEAQTRAETLADKAVGYGMPGLRVDGTDVLACYEATREAVVRARGGDGPTFIEAVSYRTAPHATADDPRAYIDLERVEQEKKRECVGRFEGYLRRAGILHDDLAASIRSEAADAMRAAIAAAEAEPPADVELLFRHAYVDPPAVFGSDLEELRRTLEE
jgi:pyruvate dehydrogenase E1 component alpha subunit